MRSLEAVRRCKDPGVGARCHRMDHPGDQGNVGRRVCSPSTKPAVCKQRYLSVTIWPFSSSVSTRQASF